jgi:signal peptidase II
MKRSALLLRLSLPVLLLDAATKYALEHATPEDWVRPVIPGFLDLVHRHNPGVAFSLLARHDAAWLRWLLVAFAFGVISLLLWMLGDAQGGTPRTRAGLALILGGASGNLLDRLARGTVLDFADFYLGPWHWPAFNVADSAIFIGACLVIWELLFARPAAAD